MTFFELFNFLGNEKLFQQMEGHRWNYILGGSDFVFNSSKGRWFKFKNWQKDLSRLYSFEEVFDEVMNDDEILESVKEEILFNLVTLQNLSLYSYD